MQKAGECEYPCWQPIETAPKDGTEILAYSDGEFAVVAWDEGLYKHGVWLIGEEYDFPATHWMLLPEPPQE